MLRRLNIQPTTVFPASRNDSLDSTSFEHNTFDNKHQVSNASTLQLPQKHRNNNNNTNINTNTTMPQGKKWLSEEYKALTIAYIQTSEELEVKALKGTGQTGEQFWKKVMVRLEANAPHGDEADGRYHNRGLLPVWNQWKDNINWNVKGFNKCLLTIYKSNPTGVTEDEKINMAIAIHVGKVDVMNYRMAEFKPNDWKLYQAWLVLKDHPAFLPPPQSNAGNTENLASDEMEDESMEDDNSATVPKKKKKKVPAVVKLEDDDRKIKSVVSGSVSGSVQVVTKKSRGVCGG